jgi:hypothetical protein
MPRFLRTHRARVLVLTAVSVVVGSYGLVRSTRRHEAPRGSDAARGGGGDGSASRAPIPSEAPSAFDTGLPRRGSDGGLRASAQSDAAPAGDSVVALRRGLASEDEATRIAAVEAAVSATAVDTLDDLEKFQLARDPETAPTVIHAVALLGASAEGAKRAGAAGTLDRWLHDELLRDGPDVLGNVSNIVEALGDVGGREAVEALGAALDRGEIALHVQTLAVQKLGELGDGRARGPVERFAMRVGAMAPAEGLDEELRVEAIEAARATLSRI